LYRARTSSVDGGGEGDTAEKAMKARYMYEMNEEQAIWATWNEKVP
jgi:hypothetical protein